MDCDICGDPIPEDSAYNKVEADHNVDGDACDACYQRLVASEQGCLDGGR